MRLSLGIVGLALLAALGSAAAQAENSLFYIGAGITNSTWTDASYYPPTDLKNTSWKAFVSVRPLKWVAVEADYIDLGSGSNTTLGTATSITNHDDSSAWAAYAIGFLPVPLPVVDFYGKAGVAHWKLNRSITQYDFYFPQNVYTSSTSLNGTDFAWGIGAQAHISVAGVRLEYESFKVNGTSADVASLSVFLNF